MINYVPKEEYIRVLWKKTEIGRILSQEKPSGFFYSPRGCGGAIKSDTLSSLEAVKKHIEKGALAIHLFYG
jgi:hypothetical protein